MPSKHINVTCKILPPKKELRWSGVLELVRKKKTISSTHYATMMLHSLEDIQELVETH